MARCSGRGGNEHVERTPPDRQRVLESYDDGVRAIRELAARVDDWAVPTPCAEWQAIDLAGHLRCVAESFLEYLQDAPDSRLAKLFAQDAPAALLIRQQARQNATELAVLPPEPGPDRITAFTVSAGAYADLMPDMWDRTHLIYRGTKYTVGDHAGAACVEWHLHAWDLARAVGEDYRPRDPRLLVSAWHWGVPHLPLASGDPWDAVLKASGRSPDWSAKGGSGEGGSGKGGAGAKGGSGGRGGSGKGAAARAKGVVGDAVPAGAVSRGNVPGKDGPPREVVVEEARSGGAQGTQGASGADGERAARGSRDEGAVRGSRGEGSVRGARGDGSVRGDASGGASAV